MFVCVKVFVCALVRIFLLVNVGMFIFLCV
jgi:hypothetical protein